MYYFLEQMWLAFKDIAAAPFQQLSVWWFLTPIIIFWIILEVYFGKHKSEELGWNTALSNGMALVWVNIESMRFLWQNHPEPFWLRFVIVSTILCYGFFIIFISFTHKLSSKTTYALASPNPIYYFSYISVLWGHGVLTLTWWVFLDLIIIYPIILLFFAIIKKILPRAKDDSDSGGLGDLGSSSDLSSPKGKSDDLGDLKL